MYKKLNFSWAHILAFLSLICIGYVTFVGLTYVMDEGFKKPALHMLGILVILLIWCIGPQQLKGIDNNYNFSKCIWWERILLFSSPIIFIICMTPFNHAMNIASKSDEIEETFKSAIVSSEKMFDEYENYSKERIGNYSSYLNRVKENKDLQPTIYKELGFGEGSNDKKIGIEVQALTRQLTENFNILNESARAWIKNADQETSVWNIFLVGNIKQIKTSIMSWSTQLKSFSELIFSTEQNETVDIKPFDANEEQLNTIIGQLDSLSSIYKNKEDKINPRTISFGIVLYFLLLFPYFVQERNGVSTYTLFGRRFIKRQAEPLKKREDDDNQVVIVKESLKNDIKMPEQPADKINIDENRGGSDSADLSKEERRRRRQQRREARNKENGIS